MHTYFFIFSCCIGWQGDSRGFESRHLRNVGRQSTFPSNFTTLPRYFLNKRSSFNDVTLFWGMTNTPLWWQPYKKGGEVNKQIICMWRHFKTTNNLSRFSDVKKTMLSFKVNLKFGRPKITTNEKIVLASMFYPLYALAVQLSPEQKSSGIQELVTTAFLTRWSCYSFLFRDSKN